MMKSVSNLNPDHVSELANEEVRYGVIWVLTKNHGFCDLSGGFENYKEAQLSDDKGS